MTLYKNNCCVFSERAAEVLAPVPRQTEGLTCNKYAKKITIINTLIILSRRTLCLQLIHLAITQLTLTISPCDGPPPKKTSDRGTNLLPASPPLPPQTLGCVSSSSCSSVSSCCCCCCCCSSWCCSRSERETRPGRRRTS